MFSFHPELTYQVNETGLFEVNMATDNAGGPNTSVDVSIGKESDAALGDILRSLLVRPAEELGDLFANGIGILVGDWVKRKRELNATQGMKEVRNRLDADGVNMKNITPPKEEELHLLINGMSLTADKGIRDLWAGLFAKALDPNSEIETERPFVSVLESLSPLDAKIIDLLSFIQKTENELQANYNEFVPHNLMNATAEDQDQVARAQKEYAALQKEAVSKICEKAKEYNLLELEGTSGWSENLMRLGVIERTSPHGFGQLPAFAPTIHDERDIANFLTGLYQKVSEMEKVSLLQAARPDRIFSQHKLGPQLNLEIQLTAFGKRFASACGVCA